MALEKCTNKTEASTLDTSTTEKLTEEALLSSATDLTTRDSSTTIKLKRQKDLANIIQSI